MEAIDIDSKQDNFKLECYLLNNYTTNGNGCWLWTWGTNPDGYGQTRWYKNTFRVCRLAAKVWLGLELSDSETHVLHMCDNRRCYNPKHLYLGTHQQNMKDCSDRGRHHNQKKTHCAQGHEFTPENTYRGPDGKRYCRTCKSKRSQERREKLKAARSAV